MTANLQPALHRAHLTLNECNPHAVVLDRDSVAWQKWSRRWYAAGYPDLYDDGQATVTDPVSATTFASLHEAAAHAASSFRWQLLNHPNVLGFTEAEARAELAGKNLACWCPLTDAQGNRVPCHADVLLELANGGAER